MSVTVPDLPCHLSLSGRFGALIFVRIQVPARALEETLERLAALPYHINPEIFPHQGDGSESAIEFPAYDSWVSAIEEAVGPAGAVRIKR